MKLRLVLVLASALALFTSTPRASAAVVDYFLTLDGIDGGSTSDTHPGAIDVLSFSWGVSQTGSAGTGSGSGAGKASFQDFSILKHVDRSSPLLFVHCAVGAHIKSAIIRCVSVADDGTTQDFFDIKLTNVLISSVKTTAATDSDPTLAVTETLTLRFDKVDWTYIPNGSAPVRGGYDLKVQKPLVEPTNNPTSAPANP